jgi:hypothetical protein
MISRTPWLSSLASLVSLVSLVSLASLAVAGCRSGYNPKGWPEAPPIRPLDDERACRDAGPSGLETFDRPAVETAMAKLDLSVCGPLAAPATDKVHVYPHVLLCTDGTAAVAEVQGDARGTPVGDCVSELYRTLRVPAFSGAPMHVRMHRVVRRPPAPAPQDAATPAPASPDR